MRSFVAMWTKVFPVCRTLLLILFAESKKRQTIGFISPFDCKDAKDITRSINIK